MNGALLAALAGAAAVAAVPGRSSAARARLRDAARGEPRLSLLPTSVAFRSPGAPDRPVSPPRDVAALAETLAGVARAGLPPARTWSVVAERSGPHAALARAVLPWLEAGAPPGRALGAITARSRAGRAGVPDLVPLAVALDVCERAGAPTAPVLEGLAAGLRAQEEARRDREVALAAPRATAAVMTVLPAVGLALGVALGVDPLGVLLGTGAGRVAFALGAGFWATGRWWTRRLVAAASAAP